MSVVRGGDSGYFFLPHLRAWELLLGSALAVAVHRLGRVRGSGGGLLGLVGLVMIVTSVISFDSSTAVPGPIVLLPTMGAALVILGAGPDNLAGTALAARPLVGIGLISYSAYLWHYPLMAFARVASRDAPSTTTLVTLGITSLVLGAASWRFVEQPFRDRTRIPRSRAIRLGVVATASLVVVGLLGSAADGWPGRMTPVQAAEYAALRTAVDDQIEHHRHCVFSTERVDGPFRARYRECLEEHGPAVMIVGDSHATDLFNALATNATAPFIVGVAQGFCRLHTPLPRCHYDGVVEFVQRQPEAIEALLYTQKGSYFLTDQRTLPVAVPLVESVLAWLGRLDTVGVDVVLVGPQLEPDVDLRNLNPMRHRVDAADARRQLDELRVVDRQLAEAASLAGLAYISKIDLVEYDFFRDFRVGEGFTYSDTDHWSAVGERIFGERLLADERLRSMFVPALPRR